MLARGVVLNGSVVDGKGSPVAGALIELQGGSASSPVLRTDSKGKFKYTVNKNDNVSLSVKKEGYISSVKWVKKHERLNTVRVVLRRI